MHWKFVHTVLDVAKGFLRPAVCYRKRQRESCILMMVTLMTTLLEASWCESLNLTDTHSPAGDCHVINCVLSHDFHVVFMQYLEFQWDVPDQSLGGEDRRIGLPSGAVQSHDQPRFVTQSLCYSVWCYKCVM